MVTFLGRHSKKSSQYYRRTMGNSSYPIPFPHNSIWYSLNRKQPLSHFYSIDKRRPSNTIFFLSSSHERWHVIWVSGAISRGKFQNDCLKCFIWNMRIMGFLHWWYGSKGKVEETPMLTHHTYFLWTIEGVILRAITTKMMMMWSDSFLNQWDLTISQCFRISKDHFAHDRNI